MANNFIIRAEKQQLCCNHFVTNRFANRYEIILINVSTILCQQSQTILCSNQVTKNDSFERLLQKLEHHVVHAMVHHVVQDSYLQY